jgi:hypothetical protein
MKLLEYQPREFALQLHNSDKRWMVLVCHRRAGKTVAACVDLLIGALETKRPSPQFAYLAPYRQQGKTVAWSYLKDLSREYWAQPPNESELTVFIKSAGGVAKIFVAGADNPDSLRGLYLDGVVLDEIGDMRPSAWHSVIRPALADRRGWAIFAGTPKGKNMFWALREEARMNPETHMLIEVKASASGILHPDELRDARAQMTEDAYLREFECSFDAAIPGAYWAKEIGALYDAGQVKPFEVEPDMAVEVVADLGFTDSCSWWVWQTGPDGYRVIDFYEDNSQSISHYIDWIKNLPYRVETVWLPHDAKAKSLQTGRSMVEAFLQGGIRPQLVPSMSLQDGIEAARQVLPYCWFNEDKVYEGLEHLRAYSREWDERSQTFKNKPKHDNHSHAADSFRYLALVAKKFGKKMSAPAVPADQDIDTDTRAYYQFTLDDLWECQPQQNQRIG